MHSCHPLRPLATDSQAGERSEKHLEGWSGISRDEKSGAGVGWRRRATGRSLMDITPFGD